MKTKTTLAYLSLIAGLMLGLYLSQAPNTQATQVERVEVRQSRPKGSQPIELYTDAQRSDTFDGCRDLFPKSQPIPLDSFGTKWKTRGLCSDAFAVLYSGLSKTPLVVVEKLSKAQLDDAKDEKRTNEFFADPRLPSADQAMLTDYRSSGYDRGHMAPAGDAPTPNAMAQTFALSNMVPQDPVNNQKVWNKLEAETRRYVRRAKGNVYVYTGPLFDARPQTIGKNEVWVPKQLFKVVYDEERGEAWAQVLLNNSDAEIRPPMSYAEFERHTGILLGLDAFFK